MNSSVKRQFFDNQIPKSSLELEDKYLSPQEAANYLGVSVKLIYDRIAREELETQRIGRLRRIRMSALRAWLEREKERR